MRDILLILACGGIPMILILSIGKLLEYNMTKGITLVKVEKTTDNFKGNYEIAKDFEKLILRVKFHEKSRFYVNNINIDPNVEIVKVFIKNLDTGKTKDLMVTPNHTLSRKKHNSIKLNGSFNIAFYQNIILDQKTLSKAGKYEINVTYGGSKSYSLILVGREK